LWRAAPTPFAADVAFISYQRQPKGIVDEGFLRQPPELVIEVLGRDTPWEKMDGMVAEYHGIGVDLVWVLDPQTESLRAYPRVGAPFVLRDTQDASADPFVPGFSVRVSRCFEI
jgi:Uma2 family endonuclease